MPDDTTPVPNGQVDAAVQDVADKARADEAAKAHDEWKARIEQDIRELRTSNAAPVVSATPAVPVEAPAPAAPDAGLATVADALEGLANVVTKPVEAVADVAEPVIDTTQAAVEHTEEVIEEAPRRTHGLFKRVFGGGHD